MSIFCTLYVIENHCAPASENRFELGLHEVRRKKRNDKSKMTVQVREPFGEIHYCFDHKGLKHDLLYSLAHSKQPRS